jgi:hypothetical protein
MRSRTEIEMAFMEILKIIQHQVFLRNCRGKVLEKLKIFSDTDRRIMRVFHAGKRRLPAWTRPQLADNAFTERVLLGLPSWLVSAPPLN